MVSHKELHIRWRLCDIKIYTTTNLSKQIVKDGLWGKHVLRNKITMKYYFNSFNFLKVFPSFHPILDWKKYTEQPYSKEMW